MDENENETEESYAMATKFSQLAIIPPRDFPTDVSKWMKINASPKMALKLMQCCKYFKHSNGFPYLVVESVSSNQHRWHYYMSGGPYISVEDIHLLPKKLWITKRVQLLFATKHFSTLLLKTGVFDVREITLLNQQLTMNEFKFLTVGGNVEEFYMTQTVIKNDMGEIVPFEDICECLPNGRKIGIGSKIPSINSLEAAETKISAKLKYLILGIQPKKYDLQNLLSYMKKHQQICYSLDFYGITDEEYAQTLAPIMDELIQKWSPEYDPPKISSKKQLTITVISLSD